MNRDRERERYEAERRYRQEDQQRSGRSPNFQDTYGQRWESAGGHRASNRDWHDERDHADPDYDAQPYGVGAEAAYGVPADDRYFARRYRAHIPEAPRRAYRPQHHEEWDHEHEGDWELQQHGHFPKPGYRAPVSGQVTQGGFWTADLDGPHSGPITGDELRGHGHFLDHDYLSWREDQLRAHDRDYHEGREERRRSYDSEYANWRQERQDRFGKDFTDWRTQRPAGESSAPSSNEMQRRSALTASRTEQDDKKGDG
jgi:hypothetical protein